MKLKNLTGYLEQIAPPSFQESYDNSGLIVGDLDIQIRGVLICLDSTEAIVDEAIALGCNVIVAHHPIVFRGIKKFNGKSYVERVVMKAIKNDIAIYAIHTNLDNVLEDGVNKMLGRKLDLKNVQILSPKKNLKKIQLHLNEDDSKRLTRSTLTNGMKIHKSLTVGNDGMQEMPVVLFEILISEGLEHAFIQKTRKLLGEDLEFELSEVSNQNSKVGSGLIGYLKNPILEVSFLKRLKSNLNLKVIRHTELLGKRVRKIAICGGAGGFLLPQAKRAGADFFVTSDYKYHEFFDAEQSLVIADIGHYESEQYTIELLYGLITKKFSNFASHCTKLDTNPVNYF